MKVVPFPVIRDPRSRLAAAVDHLVDPPLEEAPLRLLRRQRQRPFVRGDRTLAPTESRQQIRSRRVHQVIVLERAARDDRIHQGEPRRGAVAHRDRHRAVELDHRRWIDLEQHVVQAGDLRPVRLRRRGACACSAAIAACTAYEP